MVISITDENVREFIASPRAVLFVTKSGCGSCRRYEREIVAAATAGELDGVVVGALTLDRPGSARFKRENAWLREVKQLPFTVVYEDGEKIDQFAASKASYLVERLSRASAGSLGSLAAAAGQGIARTA